MVFSFMLLMTAGERKSTMPGQTGPQQHDAIGRSLLAAVPLEKIAKLAKENGSLYLRFGSTLYHPGRDVDRLEKDQRIALISDKDGRQKRVLYLEEDKTNKVLLAEYLNAFQHLSLKGIGVAFAERIK
ncbi:MAG: hypothetical protein H8D55_00585 [Deltaproteobacteria bacterium]|nr:hypothetical protein [Deltaproteobacteria bacterium]